VVAVVCSNEDEGGDEGVVCAAGAWLISDRSRAGG
jgi:hypothetical protein